MCPPLGIGDVQIIGIQLFWRFLQDFLAAKQTICHRAKRREVLVIGPLQPGRHPGTPQGRIRLQRRSVKRGVGIDHDDRGFDQHRAIMNHGRDHGIGVQLQIGWRDQFAGVTVEDTVGEIHAFLGECQPRLVPAGGSREIVKLQHLICPVRETLAISCPN